MKKKLIALLLCVVMVFSLAPAAFSTGVTLQVYSGEDPVSEVKLPANEKIELKALGSGSGDYQWQIRVSDDVWANIVAEEQNEKIELSYAMLANLLDAEGKAVIRCKLSDGDTSNNVTVQIVDAVLENKDNAPAAGTVTEPAKPVTDAVTTGSPAAVTEADTAVVAAVDYDAAISAASVDIDAAYAADPAVLDDGAAVNGDGTEIQGDGAAANDAASTPAPTTYNIVINYVYENGTQAANPWTATVAVGSSYQQTIKSPVVVGYTPDKETVEVNAFGATTYTVTYKPAEVNYTVKHWQQNISNDEYTLVATETKKGYTESAAGEGLAKSYEGFYALLYDTSTKIAADGSTEINIYYDRYYYLMNFNLNGGYGVEPIYARYGAPISVGTPTKAGYTFSGWDGTIPATMPAQSVTYNANWTVGEEAKVTIVVWGEKADYTDGEEKYDYYKNAEITATPEKTLTLEDIQGTLVCGKEEHEHTAECYSCGHYGTHTPTTVCYGITSDPIDPNSDGDQDARTHFENNCSQCSVDLKSYLKDGSVCQYKDGNKSFIITTYTYYYYLYLGGNYYKITENQYNSWKSNTGASVTHGRDTYYVYEGSSGICQHTHSASCLICGKEVHSHSSACYYNTSFMDDPSLWTLVKSDEITVAADGTSIINVYYDRVEFTLHFRKARSNSDDYGTIKARWGANIRSEFNAKCTTAGTSNWSESSDAGSPWTSYLDIMPTENRTYYAYTSGRGTSSAYYYVENIEGTSYDLYYTNTSTGTGYTVTEEEFIEIQGFTFEAEKSTKTGASFDGAKFYYTRNSYNLQFYNYNGVISGKGGSVKYEAPLKSYDFTPDYPDTLEKGAYEFAGWYTTAGCYDGSEANLDTMTMPAADVILYAKWVPVTHTVKTYQTKDALDKGEAELGTWTVSHGSAVENPPSDPTNGEYTFIGWFYTDESGNEKAFNFSMPVNRDLNLYAKWSSNKLMSYTINYVLEDGTVIAEPTTGSGLAGTTKTFNAKTGTELNTGYQSGYFPQTGSHSLTFSIEDPTQNEYTFVYVAKEKVKYTVRYLDKDTGDALADPKTEETRNAVVTETFKQINGYAPDAYQKQLVLSADDESNVITFWYVKDEVHAPVQVVHYIQNIEGDGYTEYQSSTNLNGVIGEEYSEDALTIPGFKYNETKSTSSGKLTAEGLKLELYYDRIEYPYEFRFVDQDTKEEIADSVTGSARYQKQVTQSAKSIPGYTLVSAENQAITIAVEAGETAVINVRTFYYTEQTVDIKYQVVGPVESCGTLDNYQENTVKVINGEVTGSTPTANENFKFVGWYKDEACTQPVDESWVDASNKLTPGKTKNYGTDAEKVMGYEAATYYAKFEYDVADLTITKSGCESIDENQSFIFNVTGPDGYSATVAINGNGSVTIKGLKVGTYTVTEQTGWSWRYTGTGAQSISILPTQTNTVAFTNTRSNAKWLGGDAYANNIFG
jgi:uncharacterized repeat protein (TIGR02543 family)